MAVLLILYFSPFVLFWKVVFSQIVCLSDMAFQNLRCFLVFAVLREGELSVYSLYVTGAVVRVSTVSVACLGD